MDRLRLIFQRVRTQLGELSATQKLLLGSLGVIGLMALFLVSQYAGQRSYEDLMQADPDLEAVRFLRTQGINAEQVDGRVVVPSGTRRAALAAMAESGHLPDDTTLLFNSLVEQQSWTNSREQNEQLFLIALQNELARVIAGFGGVRSASVIIDDPQPTGIGRIVRDPTASATVFTQGGGPLRQPLIDAVAGLVAGARAGLRVENVRVINGSTGTQHRATSPDDAAASNYLEHVAAVEKAMHRKIQGLLGYIPGVIVAVTARVDIARENIQTTSYLPKDEGSQTELLVGETKSQAETAGAGGAAEPGLRSNAAADINRGGSGGGGQTTSTSETSFENYVGQMVTQRFDPKGMPTSLVASVNVPRSFVVAAISGEDPENAPPDEQRIMEEFERIRQSIIESVSPHLNTGEGGSATLGAGNTDSGSTGVVKVSMIPADTGGMVEPEQAGLLGSGGGMLAMGDGLIETALLAVLSAVSLAMMVLMVRRAGKEAKLPSAEELVGIPPVLESDSELIGEVNESDGALEAVEVDESRMNRSKMLEQVGELIRQDPEQTSKLLHRWVAADD